MIFSCKRSVIQGICWEGEGAASATPTPTPASSAPIPPAAPPAGEPGATPAAGGKVTLTLKTDTPEAGEAPQPTVIPKEWDGPDWVAEKFRGSSNPMEEQAKAYSEAVKKLTSKTDELRATVESEVRDTIRQEIESEWKAARDVPETADAYKYPDQFEAPDEGLDADFRKWAHDNGLSTKAFNEAVELFGRTQINPEAELEKLGPNAETRIAAMNTWGQKNIPEDLHESALKIMSTAEGFELVEHFMNASRDAGYSPQGGSQPKPMTRDEIRQMQNDPRFYDPAQRDMKYVKQVQDAWADFARRNGGR